MGHLIALALIGSALSGPAVANVHHPVKPPGQVICVQVGPARAYNVNVPGSHNTVYQCSWYTPGEPHPLGAR